MGGHFQQKIEGTAGLQAQGRDSVGAQLRWFFRYAVLLQKPGGGGEVQKCLLEGGEQ